jgi:SecD/SecF fusion protein
MEEAGDLANILKSGKLPAPTRIVEEAVVGPTLGAEAISSGLWSMVIATIVILVFMVVYYNNSGYVANFAVLIKCILYYRCSCIIRSSINFTWYCWYRINNWYGSGCKRVN